MINQSARVSYSQSAGTTPSQYDCDCHGEQQVRLVAPHNEYQKIQLICE